MSSDFTKTSNITAVKTIKTSYHESLAVIKPVDKQGKVIIAVCIIQTDSFLRFLAEYKHSQIWHNCLK